MVTEQQVYQWLFEAVRLRNRASGIDVIHVSEVTGCLRKSYYLRTRASTISPRSAILLLGGSIHEALEEVLRRKGYLVEHQVSLQLDGFKLVGTIDAYHPDEGAVLELKTVHEIPSKPFENHVAQANIYSIMASAKNAFVVYLSRKDGKVKIFRVDPDRRMLKWAVERARTLRASLLARQPPQREKSPLCNYCEFSLLQCRVREVDGSGKQ
ncbi:MAG: Dna2/Cas4 domain-containing protein [Ignisphaera sp.]